MKVFVLLLIAALGHCQNCSPTSFWITRHTQRFTAGVDVQEMSNPIDAVLVEEGRANAELLASFVLNLDIDAVLIGERTYSYQSALPYLQATQLPATVTLAGGLTDIFFPDMAEKIANMDPCPNTLFIVHHGGQMPGVLNTLGYTGPPVENAGQYGRIYNLQFDAAGNDALTINFFAAPDDEPNTPLNCFPDTGNIPDLHALSDLLPVKF